MRPDQEAALQRLYPFAVDAAREGGERQRIEWIRNMPDGYGHAYTGPALVDLAARRRNEAGVTIVEFMQARHAEDEATARAAADYGAEWHGDVDNGAIFPSDESRHPGALLAGTWGPIEDRYVEHIARHDPARVLREVEAKRRIVDLHYLIWRDIGWMEDGEEMYEELLVCGLCVPKHSHFPTRADVPVGGCMTLRLLALPYADHPDYDPAWALA